MFGWGTAAIVSPIKNVGHEGVDYPIPIDKDLQSGTLKSNLNKNIFSINGYLN